MQPSDSRAPLIEAAAGRQSTGPALSRRGFPLLPVWLSNLWRRSTPQDEPHKKHQQQQHRYLRLAQHAPHEQPTNHLHSFLSSAISSSPPPTRRLPTLSFRSQPLGTGSRLVNALVLLFLALIGALLLIESLYLFEARSGGAGGDSAPPTSGGRLTLARVRKLLPPLNQTTTTNSPEEQEPQQHWLLQTQKCHIPRLDPWDKSIAGYVSHREPLSCAEVLREHHTWEAMTYVHQNRLRFKLFALAAGAVKKQLCCYKKVSRGPDDCAELQYSEHCLKITADNLEAPASVIEVRCDIFNYTNVHSFVVRDNEEELVASRLQDQNLVRDQYYNVIIVGVDTVSQLNAQRQFNATLNLLDGPTYRALNFTGYNKVGENTFPNLVPLLTGLTPEQLITTKCWLANTYSMITETGDDFLDNCKYLWSFYQELGYLTYFSEDWPQASTFNYLKMGFKNQPTSFYGRTHTLARDPLTLPQENMGCPKCLYESPLVELDLNNLQTFIELHKAQPMFAFQWINCPMHNSLNSGSTVDAILENFFRNIPQPVRERTFVLFISDHGYRWNDFVSTRIGHYEASLPMLRMSVPNHFIQHHPNRFENLKSHQSALITPFDLFHTLMDIRNLGASKQFVEPFLKKSAPTLTRRKQVDDDDIDDLETTKRPHRKDFLGELGAEGGLTQTVTAQLPALNGINFKQQFSTLSMLDTHTPEQLDRSCDDAGIPDSYCVCMEFMPVASDLPDVIGAAQYLVYEHINGLLKDHQDKCYFLDLESITGSDRYVFKERKPLHDKFSTANMSLIHERLSKEDEEDILNRMTTPSHQSNAAGPPLREHKLPVCEYRITVTTKPGQAVFHEVVRMYGDLDECRMKAAEAHQIINSTSTEPDAKVQAVLKLNEVCRYVIHSESISRLNLYKDQSKCINDQTEVKKVCYCR